MVSERIWPIRLSSDDKKHLAQADKHSLSHSTEYRRVSKLQNTHVIDLASQHLYLDGGGRVSVSVQEPIGSTLKSGVADSHRASGH